MIDQRRVSGSVNRDDRSCADNPFQPEEKVQSLADLNGLSLEVSLAPPATNGELVNPPVCPEPNYERGPQGDDICSGSLSRGVREPFSFKSADEFARFGSSSLTERCWRGFSAFAGTIRDFLGITTKSSGQ